MENTALAGSSMPTPLVGSDWLAANLEEPDLRILDCSVIMVTAEDGSYSFRPGLPEWREGHIPGSPFVDVMAELSDRDQELPMMLPGPEAFVEVMSGLGVGEGTRVVLYDRGEHAWAARVWWILQAFGFEAVAVLDGGWRKWVGEGRPVSAEPTSYPPGRFIPKYRPERVASRQEVLDAIDAPEVCIVNALSPESHAGEKSQFPRAGRIAGSVNVFCQSLVDKESFTFLPREELRARFAAVGALDAERAVTYCGAGIAAAADAFVLTLIGHDNVAVYDGSLAEWTADSELPMETG